MQHGYYQMRFMSAGLILKAVLLIKNHLIRMQHTVNGTAIVTFSDGIELSSDYMLAETTSPTGYTVDKKVTYVRVSADGRVTYKSDAEGAEYTSNVPQYTNIRNAVVVNLYKEFAGIDLSKLSQDEIAALENGTEFTLYQDKVAVQTAHPVISNGKATVTFENVSVGAVYTISETKAADGWNVNSAVYTCQISYDGTVSYKAGAQEFSSEVPICVNEKVQSEDNSDKTDDNVKSDKKDDEKSVKTGDNSHVEIFVVLLAVSSLALAILFKIRKRTENDATE